MKKFKLPNDAMVVTSSYVTQDLLPILEITHDDDEEGGSLWQFHCGNGDYSMERMQLVRLDTVLAIDPSVVDVADMALGNVATRIEKLSPWSLRKASGGDSPSS